MKMKIGVLIVSAAIIATAGIAFARDSGGNDEPAAATAPMAPHVPVAEVLSRQIVPSAEFTGSLAAPKTVELRPRVGGAIDAVSVPEGSIVRQGQLLFQIDPRPFQVALNSAQARLKQAEALAIQANRDFERVGRLVNNGAVSRKDYDDATSTRHARQAEVQAAKAAVAAATLDLSYSRVAAPITGRVDRMLVTEGNLVSGGGTGSATLLTTIVSVNPLYAYFDIDEATFLNSVSKARPDAANKVEERLPVHVGLATEKGFPHQGTLDFVGNQIDRSTGTVRVRAVIPNEDGKLTPGAFARVQLATGAAHQAILIDDQAIGSDQGRNYVLVVGADNKAQYRPIELGAVVDGLRVVKSGLKAGENIIIKGLVRPGMAVTPRLTPMQASGASVSEGEKAGSVEGGGQ